ncbi:hypothetical protein T439DRAFT_320225 [Meredithblackwellia eburnea MCA 4105]
MPTRVQTRWCRLFWLALVFSQAVQAINSINGVNFVESPVNFLISTQYDTTMEIPECALVTISFTAMPGVSPPSGGYAEYWAVSDNYIVQTESNSSLTSFPGQMSTRFQFPAGSKVVLWTVKGPGYAGAVNIGSKAPVLGPYTIVPSNGSSSCILRSKDGDLGGSWSTSIDSTKIACGPFNVSFASTYSSNVSSSTMYENGMEILSVDRKGGGTLDGLALNLGPAFNFYSLNVTDLIAPGGEFWLFPDSALKARRFLNGVGTSLCTNNSLPSPSPYPNPAPSPRPSSSKSSIGGGAIAGIAIGGFAGCSLLIGLALVLYKKKLRKEKEWPTQPTKMEKDLWEDERVTHDGIMPRFGEAGPPPISYHSDMPNLNSTGTNFNSTHIQKR